MSENQSGGSSSSGLGCLAPLVGIAGLVATFALGPIDLGRTVYNLIIGDTSTIKKELVDYSRRDLVKECPSYDLLTIERILAHEFKYKLEGDKINPSDISMVKLWDASEDHAQSGYQGWVWPSLER